MVGGLLFMDLIIALVKYQRENKHSTCWNWNGIIIVEGLPGFCYWTRYVTPWIILRHWHLKGIIITTGLAGYCSWAQYYIKYWVALFTYLHSSRASAWATQKHKSTMMLFQPPKVRLPLANVSEKPSIGEILQSRCLRLPSCPRIQVIFLKRDLAWSECFFFHVLLYTVWGLSTIDGVPVIVTPTNLKGHLHPQSSLHAIFLLRFHDCSPTQTQRAVSIRIPPQSSS
jgi:hypothetical protein